MIVVDTSALSFVFRRRGTMTPSPVVERFSALVRDNVDVAIPGIVLQELLSGVRNAEQGDALLHALGGFRILLSTREDHLQAAQVFNDCLRRGKTVASIDALIAAQTIAREAILFTTDKDFARVDGLRLLG